MAEEIKLYKRSKVERLAIANTLLDGVATECKISLYQKFLTIAWKLSQIASICWKGWRNNNV